MTAPIKTRAPGTYVEIEYDRSRSKDEAVPDRSDQLSFDAQVEQGPLTFGAAVELSGGLQTSGAAALSSAAGGAEIYAEAERIYGDVTGHVTAFEELGAELQTTLAGLEENPNDLALMTKALELGRALESELGSSRASLDDASKLLDDVEKLANQLGDGRSELVASAMIRELAEQRAGIRSPALRLGADHRIDASISGHLIEPFPLGEGLRAQVDALQLPIDPQNAMIAVRAYITVDVQGIDALKQSARDAQATLAELDGLLAEAEGELHDANEDPLGAASDPELADRTAALTEEITAKADALTASLDAISEDFSVETKAEIEVVEATARIGAGVDEMSVRWRFDPSENFHLAVRGYIQHAGGVLGAESTKLDSPNHDGTLAVASKEQINGYNVFFPRTAGAEVRFHTDPSSSRTTEVEAGFAAGGGALAAHLQLTRELGRLTFRTGVLATDRDVRGLAGAGVEVGGRRRVAIDVTGTLDPTLSGGSLAIGFRPIKP